MSAIDPPWGALRPAAAARAVLWTSRHTPLGRGAMRKALFSAFSKMHPGPVDCMLWGAPARLHPTRNVSERKALMRPDQMDAGEHALVRDVMAKPGAVFVDVGGNAGLYSLNAALSAAPGARIVMIEPDPSLIARLGVNLALARAAGLVEASVTVERFALAVGDREGSGFLSGPGDEGSRSVGNAASDGGRVVRLATLQSVLQQAGVDRVDLMKIDVEGYEDRVLPPFLAHSERRLWPRQLIIEHLQRARWRPDCLADCETRGYRLIFTTRNNSVLKRDDDP